VLDRQYRSAFSISHQQKIISEAYLSVRSILQTASISLSSESDKVLAERVGVGIATSYGLDGRDSIPDNARFFFPSPQCPDCLWSTPSHLASAHRAVSRRVKRLEREADHSRPSTSKVKNNGAIPPLPQYLYGIMLN
jgi:hypothetical protein